MKKYFKHPAFTLSTGIILANVFSILTVPLLTRLYPTAAFGHFAVYYAVSSLLGMFSTLRFELALPIIKDDADAGALAAGTLALSTLACAAVAIALWLSPLPVTWASLPTDGLFYLMTLATSILTGASQVLTQMNVRANRLNLLSVRHILEKAVVAGLAFWFVRLGWLDRGLILSQTIGAAVAVLLLAFGQRRALTRGLAQGFGRARALAHEYRDFPLKNILATGSQLLANQMPTLVLSSYFGPTALGFLNIAQRLTDAPTAIVGSSLAVVNYRHILSLSPAARKNWFSKSVLLSTLAFVGPAVLVALYAPVIIPRLVGAQWTDSAPYLVALLPVGTLRLVFLLQQPMLIVTRRLHVELACSVALLVGTAASLSYGVWTHADLPQIAATYSVINACVYAATVFVIGRGL